MGWMEEREAWRGSAAALWPEARSIIMLAELYTPEEDPRQVLEARGHGAVSVYAQGRDYHDLVKKRLKRLGRWLVAETGCEIKVFVDTAPVMEKPLAQAAGLGWQGKHTNLLSRELGNWFFLGAIFTTLELPRDAPGREHCGSCRACLDACPTGAFPAPFQLDARRCISYLTIEHRGPVEGRAAGADGQPDLRLRRLPCGLPVEQVRAGGFRDRLCGAGGGSAPRGAGGTGRGGLPGALLGQPDQAHRARPVPAQRAFTPSAIRAIGGFGRRLRRMWTTPTWRWRMRHAGRWRGWTKNRHSEGPYPWREVPMPVPSLPAALAIYLPVREPSYLVRLPSGQAARCVGRLALSGGQPARAQRGGGLDRGEDRAAPVPAQDAQAALCAPSQCRSGRLDRAGHGACPWCAGAAGRPRDGGACRSCRGGIVVCAGGSAAPIAAPLRSGLGTLGGKLGWRAVLPYAGAV